MAAYNSTCKQLLRVQVIMPSTSLSLLQEVTCLATSKRLACIGTADGAFLVWDLLQVSSVGEPDASCKGAS